MFDWSLYHFVRDYTQVHTDRESIFVFQFELEGDHNLGP